MNGLGVDARDFLPIAEQLDLSRILPMRFLFTILLHRSVTIKWYGYLHRQRPCLRVFQRKYAQDFLRSGPICLSHARIFCLLTVQP